MKSHRKIATSAEVYAVIFARHRDALTPFATLSSPDGDPYGNPDECVMMTEWGFDGAEVPTLGHKTTWDKDHEKPHNRLNQRSAYWLCVSKELEL